VTRILLLIQTLTGGTPVHFSILRVLLALVAPLAGLVATGPAWAEDYVFSSGAKGGFYHNVASRLVRLLGEEQRTARNQVSGGSAQNLLQLATPMSAVNVVLAQADAVRFFLDEHPDFSRELVVLDDLGRECVVLITSVENGISSAADLKTGGFGSLVTPGLGSGASVTLEYMSRMDRAYRKTAVIHREPMEAMRQMHAGEKIAAVMLVKRPNTLTPELKRVLENPEQFRIAPIRAEDVKNGALPDGSPVYSFDEVRTGVGSDYQIRFETMCTRALMLTSSTKLDESARRDLARGLLKWRALSAPERE
jgi:TRAP-type uncharacterized transport system substrate-binding protein